VERRDADDVAFHVSSIPPLRLYCRTIFNTSEIWVTRGVTECCILFCDPIVYSFMYAKITNYILMHVMDGRESNVWLLVNNCMHLLFEIGYTMIFARLL
jgi:hypothetical protein